MRHAPLSALGQVSTVSGSDFMQLLQNIKISYQRQNFMQQSDTTIARGILVNYNENTLWKFFFYNSTLHLDTRCAGILLCLGYRFLIASTKFQSQVNVLLRIPFSFRRLEERLCPHHVLHVSHNINTFAAVTHCTLTRARMQLLQMFDN